MKMIAIGDESVPVGQYTQQIYEYLGTWDAIKAKANLGGNARAVLSWVASGDVDCGIVYATDAASMAHAWKGVPTAVIAIPRRYSHSPVELCNINDAVDSLKLLKRMVQENGKHSLDFI